MASRMGPSCFARALVVALVCAPAGAAQRPDARGYLTTPLELQIVREKADEGVEPFATSRAEVLAIAAEPWIADMSAHETCPDSNTPRWNDNSGGTPSTYANALAYHLTGDASHAQAVRTRLEAVMTQVLSMDPDCDTNFGWGTAELVASADLIEDYWEGLSCSGPLVPAPGDPTLGTGPCKVLFQNWLAKLVYPLLSKMATSSQNNRGAAGTNTLAYVSDYLWDRNDVILVHHNPNRVNGGEDQFFTPAEAFAHVRQLALDRMNGYRIDLGDASCDYLGGIFHSPSYPPVKSQITPNGIIPEDARRDEYCNVPVYDGSYQNYPQGHIGHNIQQCELLLRRGDRSCYDNLDTSDLPNYPVLGPDGVLRTTHLEPGRGSLERAIKAIVIDSNTEWRQDATLEVALNYYRHHGRFEGVGSWRGQIGNRDQCTNGLCLTTLTHGFPFDSPLKAVDAPAGGEALLVDVSVASGAARVPLEYGACAEPGGAVHALRGVGPLAGLAYFGSVLYGLEQDETDGSAWLVEISPSVCAEGMRVGAVPIGFSGLESLAACPDGSLYSADWNPASRRSRLLRIDRGSGIGSLVGSHVMGPGLRIVGLACEAAGGTLWALGSGSAPRQAELVRVNPATGVETVIGPTGTASGELQALEIDRGAADLRLLAAGSALWSLDPASGAAAPLGAGLDGARGLAMPAPSSGPDWDNDWLPDAADNCPRAANPEQLDTDADGFGNACDSDFNNDGRVDNLDFQRVRRSFGAAPGSPAFDPNLDADGDGLIGNEEFNALLRSFLGPPGPSGLACAGTIPCP